MSAICIASSHGWLLFSNKHSNPQLRLLNPITGVTIGLPSPTTLPTPNIVRPSPGSTNYYLNVRVFLSDHHLRHDSRKNNIMVFASCCSGSGADMQNRLAYANAGDQVWTPIAEPHSFTGMADFTFHKGKLYGVFDNSDGALVVIMDINPPTSPPRYIYPRWQDSFKPLRLSICSRMAYHLMDSVDGEDLLLVLSSVPPFFYRTYFWVMKLDSEAQLWLPLRRLQDQTAIFLAGNRSMALSTRGSPELKENCIYFTWSQCHLGPGDEGIFDLQNGTISPLFRHHYSFTSSLHHWFTPAL